MSGDYMKVPLITPAFWAIKVCCTNVGETAAGFMVDGAPGLGLGISCVVVGAFLAVALFCQFWVSRYYAPVYWLAVMLTSVEGTLLADLLADAAGEELWLPALAFALLLATVFAAWYHQEGILEIHIIQSMSRESFYWLTVITTFALGTAFGDLLSEDVFGSFAVSFVMFGTFILLVAGLWKVQLSWFGPVPAFWTAYMLTCPLGASIGDLLSQPKADGGLNMGATTTSVVLVATILGLLGYLSYTKVDLVAIAPAGEAAPAARRAPELKTASGLAGDALLARAGPGLSFTSAGSRADFAQGLPGVALKAVGGPGSKSSRRTSMSSKRPPPPQEWHFSRDSTADRFGKHTPQRPVLSGEGPPAQEVMAAGGGYRLAGAAVVPGLLAPTLGAGGFFEGGAVMGATSATTTGTSHEGRSQAAAAAAAAAKGALPAAYRPHATAAAGSARSTLCPAGHALRVGEGPLAADAHGALARRGAHAAAAAALHAFAGAVAAGGAHGAGSGGAFGVDSDTLEGDAPPPAAIGVVADWDGAV